MSAQSDLKPIKLWGNGGPNPPKVRILLEELGLPYEVVPVAWADVKQPGYLAVNPNGRLPSIQDPNLDLTLWESGAIVEYLIERYDKEHKLSFPAGTVESYHAKQWLFFQATGQGPYFGQAVWFTKFHHEQLPSAKERYVKEIKRVTGVLEGWLEKQKGIYGEGDGPWLVGNKLSFADLSFILWQKTAERMLPEDYSVDEYPLVKEWLAKMVARPSVVKTFAEVDH
ncbi:glutathione S-transferase-like protein [Podospora aff. communis PSN243]|uniref:Glutathione S-transferase-like protein n=1 Tax=Podospora aff. communis PSN243 TaxID=3040156 RepID=A0AAV9GJ95_9PEZI|nr:glutathione S-transferase-like protein [Podospora aff. communis PSN243]